MNGDELGLIRPRGIHCLFLLVEHSARYWSAHPTKQLSDTTKEHRLGLSPIAISSHRKEVTQRPGL